MQRQLKEKHESAEIRRRNRWYKNLFHPSRNRQRLCSFLQESSSSHSLFYSFDFCFFVSSEIFVTRCLLTPYITSMAADVPRSAEWFLPLLLFNTTIKGLNYRNGPNSKPVSITNSSCFRTGQLKSDLWQHPQKKKKKKKKKEKKRLIILF